MVLPLPPAPRDSTQPAADAGAAAPAPPGWHQPTAASPNPLLSLRVACRRWESGELFILGGQRATVRASCTRLTKFTVEDEEYRTDVELSEPDEGGSFTCELAVDHALVFSILRQPAALVAQARTGHLAGAEPGFPGTYWQDVGLLGGIVPRDLGVL